VGYRARRHAGLVDLAKIGGLSRSGTGSLITTPTGGVSSSWILDEFYILASDEYVVVGDDEAAEMVAY